MNGECHGSRVKGGEVPVLGDWRGHGVWGTERGHSPQVSGQFWVTPASLSLPRSALSEPKGIACKMQASPPPSAGFARMMDL